MKFQLLIPSYTDILKQQYSSTWEYEARRRLWSCPSLSLLTVAAMLPEDAELSYTDLNYPAKADSCPDCPSPTPETESGLSPAPQETDSSDKNTAAAHIPFLYFIFYPISARPFAHVRFVDAVFCPLILCSL